MLSSMAWQSKGPLLFNALAPAPAAVIGKSTIIGGSGSPAARVRVSSILDSEARCKGPLLVFDISADEVGVPSCKKLEPRRQKELKVGLIGNALGNSHFDVS